MLELFGIFSPEDLTLLVDRELEIGDQDLELCWRKVTCRKTEKNLSFNMKQSSMAMTYQEEHSLLISFPRKFL